MIRILFYVLVVLALASGFSWLAERPGELSVLWQGQLIKMSLMVAASLLVTFIALIMFVWWLVRTIWTSPQSITRYFRARKRDRGYQALSTGLIAAGAGNAALARKMNARAKDLLRSDQEPLIHLLEAQASLIEGRHDEARLKFEAMAEDPETRELGLRGLYLEAKRQGADEAARQYAERAVEKAPQLTWAAEATLGHLTKAGHYDDAIRLLEQSRLAGAIGKKEAETSKAALLTARAATKLDADVKGAREDALMALRIDENLVPAGVIAAKALFREGNLRKGSATLEHIWKHVQHPDIARTFVRARAGDSAADRMKRAERLDSMRPNNAIALACLAETALDMRDFALARQKAEASARMNPSASAFLLLADIEEADTGDQGRIRHWLALARKAPRDAAWVADGYVSETWLPVSPVSGRIGAFEWKVPFAEIDGPIVDEALSDINEAFLSLPPVYEPAIPPEPTPITEPVVIPPVVDAVAPSAQSAAASEPAPVTPPAPAEKARMVATAPVPAPQPFFGHAPDDPGVRSGQTEPKSKFRLF